MRLAHYRHWSCQPLLLSIYLSTAAATLLHSSLSFAAASQEVINYNIAAGDLGQALNQFAIQSSIPVSAEQKLIQAAKTQGLHGRYTTAQGFAQLLAGTAFSAERTEEGYVIVKKNLSAEPVYAGELSTIEVDALNVDSGKQGNVQQLPLIIVSSIEADGSAEQGYVAKKLKQVGPWGEKSLQDTPYAISVMSSDLMENVIAGDIDQLYKMNPVTQSSALTTVWGYPVANIRGFSTSVGIVDGVRLSSYSYGVSTEELERIEIMNGLSGFMYGAGNVGGTTNYVLKRPSYQKIANVTLGNYGNEQWFGHIDLGNKIDADGQFAYRFNAAYQNGETAKDDQNVKKYLFSGALDWHVTEDLLLQLEAAHKYWRVDRPDNRFYASGLDHWPDAYDNSKTYSPSWAYNQTKTDRIGVNATWKINDVFSLRSAYLYKQDEREYIIIYPVRRADGWTLYRPGKTPAYDTISKAGYTYLDAVFNTLGINHKLTLGISVDNYQEKKYSNSYVYDDSYVPPSGLSDAELMALAKPNFSTDYGHRYTATDNSNLNIILGDEIIFNTKWSALLGLNYSNLETNSYNTDGSLSSGYDQSELTPTLSLIFKPFAQLTTYISYMESLETGLTVGDDETLYANPGQVFDPYVSKQYEAGAKYALKDNLLLSTALFRIEKANSYEETLSNGLILYSQDGKQIHQGLELSLTGKLSERLTVMGGGTWMDLSVEKASNTAIEGKKPIGAASVLAKLYLEYRLPFMDQLTLTGGAYYTGSKYKNNTNTQKIDGYTLIDLGLRYQTKLGTYPTSFNLNATNITGRDYWSSEWQLGSPRSIAFSVKTEF
jgi:iron complex outermembrane receptor protein